MNIVGLQCCVSFKCTAEWIGYTYIHSYSGSFPIYVITEYWVEFLVWYSSFLLVVYLYIKVVLITGLGSPSICFYRYRNQLTFKRTGLAQSSESFISPLSGMCNKKGFPKWVLVIPVTHFRGTFYDLICVVRKCRIEVFWI